MEKFNNMSIISEALKELKEDLNEDKEEGFVIHYTFPGFGSMGKEYYNEKGVTLRRGGEKRHFVPRERATVYSSYSKAEKALLKAQKDLESWFNTFIKEKPFNHVEKWEILKVNEEEGEEDNIRLWNSLGHSIDKSHHFYKSVEEAKKYIKDNHIDQWVIIKWTGWKSVVLEKSPGFIDLSDSRKLGSFDSKREGKPSEVFEYSFEDGGWVLTDAYKAALSLYKQEDKSDLIMKSWRDLKDNMFMLSDGNEEFIFFKKDGTVEPTALRRPKTTYTVGAEEPSKYVPKVESLKEEHEMTPEQDDAIGYKLIENLNGVKQEIEEGEWVNLTAGLLPYEYGYDTSGYEDLAIDVKKVDDRYNVYFYLETEDGPVNEPDEDHPDYSFDTFEELEEFIKNGYKI